MKLSVIIPAYKEPYLQKTVDSLLASSELGSDLEVFVVLDGPGLWPVGLINDKRVSVIQFPENRGLRAGINAGLERAKGEYVLKVDAHCAFDKGFDRIMVENCQDNWLVIPRRYSLDEDNWTKTGQRRKPVRDYHYLSYPMADAKLGPMTPQNWSKRHSEEEIDDTMTFQGSCWMANREYLMNHVGFLDDSYSAYGTFVGEQLEIGLNYWLSGGEVRVNKKTWYAHLAKMPRHYDSGEYQRKESEQNAIHWTWAADHWLHDKEPGMAKPFSWLVEKFWPVPGWPEDRSLWRLN